MSTMTDIQARFEAEERARRSGFMPDRLGEPAPTVRPREDQKLIYDSMRSAGYSPEMGNIMARHGESGEIGARPGGAWQPPQEGPLVARGTTATTNQGIDFGAMEARYNNERIAGLTGGRMDQGAMGLTRDLRGMAGQGMTNEAQGRFMQNREADWSSRMDRTQRDQMFAKDDATKRFDIQSQANVKASEMALQGRLADMSGFKSGPGGESVYQSPTGAVENMQPSEEQKARTTIGKMNEDLKAGRITQQQYDDELARKSQMNPALAMLSYALGGGTPPAGGIVDTTVLGGTAGGQVKWTADGKKAVSTDGGKTWRLAK
jgi:hypothetical protein